MSRKLFLLSLFLSVRGQEVISGTSVTSTKYNLLVTYLHNCLIHIFDPTSNHLLIFSSDLLVILRTMWDPQWRQTIYLNQFLHISGIFMIKPTPTSITCIILEYFRHKNLRVPTGHPKILAQWGTCLLCINSLSWGRPPLLKSCWEKSHLEISFTEKQVLYIEKMDLHCEKFPKKNLL